MGGAGVNERKGVPPETLRRWHSKFRLYNMDIGVLISFTVLSFIGSSEFAGCW